MRPIAKGSRAEGRTLEEVAVHLNKLGYRTRTGKFWTQATVDRLIRVVADWE